MGNYYILFGTKDSIMYYIFNTNPILWSPDRFMAKSYNDRYVAEFAVLRDWFNFKHISDLIDNGMLDAFYVATINEHNIEIERTKLL